LEASRAFALFDASGAARGTSSAPVSAMTGARTISDWLPEIDSYRWATLWAGIEAGREEKFWTISRVAGAADGEGYVTIRSVIQDGERYAGVEVRPSTETTTKLRLGALQQEVLEAVASGAPIVDCMAILCRHAEELAPSVVCSVLAVDSGGKLRPLASPSLPTYYSDAIDGADIGPNSGSCGTAAYLGQPVTVTDIATDPLWAEFRSHALELGLKACWSSPIKSRSGRVIGTFAFYFHATRGPTALERRIVDACVHVCAVALEHHETQSRIEEMAYHDALTQLANRPGFQSSLVDALRKRPQGGVAIAVHCIDLEDFKSVNDSLGHPIGDKLLQAVARRLRTVTRRSETIARMGSDEFAIIQPGIEGDSDAASLAERVIEVIRQPYDIDGHKIVVGASVGTAIGRYDAVTADILMCNADLALYHAKLERRGSFRLFSPEIDARVRAQRSLESDLRSALADGQFELNFQPLFSAKRRKISGFEALMRWHHPQRGLVPASEFIPAAERIGLIAALGEFALREACTTAARWPEHLRIAVNLSPAQFAASGLVKAVSDALANSGLAPNRLELEITETVLLQNSQATRDTLFELRALGVRIALDDFGTGYSSLSYLLSFPFDKIKIDRSFIEDIVANSRSQKIVKAVVAMASDLDMETTAEGIETDEQLAAVCKAGCTEIQGYLLGRPQPARDVDKLVADLTARRGAKQSAKSPRKRQAASTHRSVGTSVRH
jgi:diguanylate cyclase (GGDEF)-like protein